MNLLVLCPSKGRSEKARELLDSFEATRSLGSTKLIFILDEGEEAPYTGNVMSVPPSGRRGMVDPVNTVAELVWDQWDIIGFVGDDHRFKTTGWDQHFVRHADKVGPCLMYGNDMNWRDGEIPTQIFGSSEIWRALGWMALPTCQHLYVDNAWRLIGDELRALYYFPDIVIEHEHPAYSKTDWDEGYLAVNSSDMYARDRAAYQDWVENKAQEDIARVRASLAG